MSAERYSELPAKTRVFLDDLREEDVELLSEGIALVRSLRTVGRLLKWLILGVVATIVAVSSIWEGALKILGLYRGQ